MTTLQIRSKGTITLPSSLRRKYKVNKGDVFTLIDLGNGAFLLTPRRSNIDETADKLRLELESRGETLETMLKTLREVREEYASQND